MADSFHSARLTRLSLAHQRRKEVEPKAASISPTWTEHANLTAAFDASPTFSPESGCKAQNTTTFGAFSIRSLDVPQVCLHSLILRDHRISLRSAPFASKTGEKVGLGAYGAQVYDLHRDL